MLAVNSIFSELKRRRVFRVALAYGVIASALVQVGGTILPIFHAPDWSQQAFILLVAIGFPRGADPRLGLRRYGGRNPKNAGSGGAGAPVSLMPVERDAYDGPLVLQGLAQVYTWTGEKDKAFEVLRRLLSLPGYVSYGYLKMDPAWKPLRSDRRFQELLSSIAPKREDRRS
jgi:hypothetical protein